MKRHRFPYSQSQDDVQAVLPFVPITLSYQKNELEISALVDSGSTVNVLPYDIGSDLGLIWEIQDFPIRLAGTLKNTPAYGVLLTGQIADFSPVTLAFAWTQKSSNTIPVILGQMNFFREFKILFDGKAAIFELIQHKMEPS